MTTPDNKHAHAVLDAKTESFKIKGNWTEQARLLKDKYGALTDSDLKFEPGKENDLLKRVEFRLNKKRDEVINIINKCEV